MVVGKCSLPAGSSRNIGDLFSGIEIAVGSFEDLVERKVGESGELGDDIEVAESRFQMVHIPVAHLVEGLYNLDIVLGTSFEMLDFPQRDVAVVVDELELYYALASLLVR